MKNSTFITSAVVAALSAGAAGAADLGSSSYEAGVSLLMPENTGFMYTAQVDAQGLGLGTSAVSTTGASFTLTGFATTSGAAPTQSEANPSALTTSGSGVYSDFTFDRTVATNAMSSGQGRVVATGEALGSIGGVGSAAGKSTQQTIVNTTQAATTSADGSSVDTLTNSTSSSESAASLVGGARTTLVAGVVGTTDTFIGDTGTSVTDSQVGKAVAGVLTKGNDSGITIDPTNAPAYDQIYDGTHDTIALASGTGVTGITGTWGAGNLDLTVRNAGGGTVSLGAETGGFFTGGVSTLGKSGLNSSASTTVLPQLPPN